MDTVKIFTMATAGAALLTLGTGGAVQAEVLASQELDFSVGSGIPFSNEFEVTTSILKRIEGAPGGFFPSPSDPVLFEGTIVTPSDVGRTFTATQATDPDFNNFIALLTDGEPNRIDVDFKALNGGGAGIGASESFLFFGNDPNRIDFSGNTINSVSLRINSLTVANPPVENPGGFAINSLSGSVTLSVDSEPVPEPSSILGLGMALGFGVLMKKQYSRRKKI